MKFAKLTVIAVFLLMMASATFAGEGSAPPEVAPPAQAKLSGSAGVEAFATPVAEGNGEATLLISSQDCQASSAAFTTEGGEPDAESSFPWSCGACSVQQCQGQAEGTTPCYMGSGAGWGTCIAATTNTCPGTQTWHCTCGRYYY